MTLLLSALLLGAAAVAYGKRSRWVPLVLLLPFLGVSVHLAAEVIHPLSPALFWGMVALGAGLPLLAIVVVSLDCRFGLFCLDTFFGLALAILLPPLLLVGNAAACLARAVTGP